PHQERVPRRDVARLPQPAHRGARRGRAPSGRAAGQPDAAAARPRRERRTQRAPPRGVHRAAPRDGAARGGPDHAREGAARPGRAPPRRRRRAQSARERGDAGRRIDLRGTPAGRDPVKILIVDDEPDVRALVRNSLAYATQDMTPLEAGDGDEAMSLIGSERPDLVVLDLALPHRDGFTVLEELRRSSDLPVIVLAARGLVDDKVRGLQLGADDYMTKPFSPRELVARIESVLLRSVPRTARGVSERGP